VDDPHGDRAACFRPAADFRLGLGCGAVYLHAFLNALSTRGAAVPDRLDVCGGVFSAAGEHI